MTLKWIGAVIIIASCGSVGFSMAAAHRQEEAALRQLLGALEMMGCELQQRLQPLALLCKLAGKECRGSLKQVFEGLGEELNKQISPDASICMEAALSSATKLPPITHAILEQLGRSLGLFDLEGQMAGLQTAKASCQNALDALQLNRESRLRGYQTLGLCAGAALAILLL